MKSSRGGARPGAGRKPSGDQAMVTRAFVITRGQADLIDRMLMRGEGTRSHIVRAALDYYFKDLDWSTNPASTRTT